MDVAAGDESTTLMRCFVIGPIGNRFEPIGSPGREIYEDALEIFERVIQPACSRFSLDPVRADQIAATGEITEQVYRHLFEDEVVIADVSGGNQNVMYELGLRHTRNLLTIPVGEFGQLPFDLAAVRTIQFSRSERGLIDARKQLERALEAGLTEVPEPLTPTRIWSAGLYGVVVDEPVPEPSGGNPTVEDVDADGFLEQLQSIEETLPHLGVITEGIGRVMEKMGAIASDSNAELGSVEVTGMNAKQRLSIVARFSNALQEPADRLTNLTSEFSDQMQSLNPDVVGLLKFIEGNGSADEMDDSQSFVVQILDLAKTARESNQMLGGFGDSVGRLGEVSRVLRRPSMQIRRAIESMSVAIAITDEWEAAAVRAKNALRV